MLRLLFVIMWSKSIKGTEYCNYVVCYNPSCYSANFINSKLLIKQKTANILPDRHQNDMKITTFIESKISGCLLRLGFYNQFWQLFT